MLAWPAGAYTHYNLNVIVNTFVTSGTVQMAEYAQSGHAVLSKRRLTVCVVGSGGVGKSSLTIRYLQGHFPEVSGRRLADCVYASSSGKLCQRSYFIVMFSSSSF